MKRGLFALLCLLITICTVGARHVVPLQQTVSGTEDAPSPWCVSVWYPSADTGGLDSIRAHADEIDVINPFWYAPNPDGTLRAAETEDADLLAEWRADGTKIIATIATNGDWSMIAAPELRAFHVQQIVQLAEEMSYDGIDIDYEGFSLGSRDAFSEFIEALSAELHARGKLLTAAVHAKISDAGTWEAAAAQDWTRLAPAVDALEVMTYDYTSRNKPPGPLGPPAWVHDVVAYAATVTGLGKVRMGLGFYAYRWQRDNPPATTTSWQAIQPLIQSFQPEILRDQDVMEAHVELKLRGLPKQTIYFADSIGIEYKVAQVLNDFPTLGGVAIWGIGGEDPANWDVLRSARQTNCRL